MPLTPQQQRCFEDRGYLVLPGALRADTASPARMPPLRRVIEHEGGLAERAARARAAMAERSRG